jgi:hypothetical protein
MVPISIVHNGGGRPGPSFPDRKGSFDEAADGEQAGAHLDQCKGSDRDCDERAHG